MPASADIVRVFFALWPDDATRGELAQLATGLRRECGGRAVPARNLHLTLLFVGNLEAKRVTRLRALAAGVIAPAFEMVVEVVDYWRHNRILWAGPRRCPPALRTLAAGLEGALRAECFRFDERPYVPHVTLRRHARGAPGATAAGDIAWRARDFVLVQSVRSDSGSAYEVIGRWPLAKSQENVKS